MGSEMCIRDRMITAITGHLLRYFVREDAQPLFADSKACSHATYQYVLLIHESQLENVFFTPAASLAMSRCHMRVAMIAVHLVGFSQECLKLRLLSP